MHQEIMHFYSLKKNEIISQAKEAAKKETKNQKLHPVEIETNPEQLFRELMEISPDGNVPPHLLERLKKLESNNVKIYSNSDSQIKENSKDISTEDALNLYTQFQQFLLEDDID